MPAGRKESWVNMVSRMLTDQMDEMVQTLIDDEVFQLMVTVSPEEQIGRFLTPEIRAEMEAEAFAKGGQPAVDSYRAHMQQMMARRMAKGGE